ncbi:MAG: hypothetical protein ACKV2V_25865 [Blastocatellia bacterium]
MAVYEHSYQPYAGAKTPEWSRWLILPRYAYQDVFSSRFFTALFALSFAPVLVAAILIYLHHNSSALTMMEITVSDIISINGAFFRRLMSVQVNFAALLTVIIGPVLISRDLTNNALPLYLCRPFSRAEYVIGKMAVLVILLSVITWIPVMLLFGFQCVLEGATWIRENLWIGVAVLVNSWTWILLLSLLSTALSALIKWRLAASGALFAFFMIPIPVATVISIQLKTAWGFMLAPAFVMHRLQEYLFRTPTTFTVRGAGGVPATPAWIMFGLICAVSLFVLTRRVRAYEVIR